MQRAIACRLSGIWEVCARQRTRACPRPCIQEENEKKKKKAEPLAEIFIPALYYYVTYTLMRAERTTSPPHAGPHLGVRR